MQEFKEIWMPIKGYENEYMVSNYGRVKGLDRPVRRGRNGSSGYTIQKGIILKPQLKPNGYLYVGLYKHNSNKIRTIAIHKLVSQAFLKNPDPTLYREVNHKDFNRTNNHVDNLEFMTHSQNSHYSYEHRRKAPVVQLDEDDNVINFFYRETDAKELGFNPSGISNTVRGINRTHLGYHWRYATEEEINKYITNKENEDNRNKTNDATN